MFIFFLLRNQQQRWTTETFPAKHPTCGCKLRQIVHFSRFSQHDNTYWSCTLKFNMKKHCYTHALGHKQTRKCCTTLSPQQTKSFMQLTGDIESYSGRDLESVHRPFQKSICQSSRHPSFIMWRWPVLKLSTVMLLSLCNTALLLSHPAQTCCAAKELKKTQKHRIKNEAKELVLKPKSKDGKCMNLPFFQLDSWIRGSSRQPMKYKRQLISLSEPQAT